MNESEISAVFKELINSSARLQIVNKVLKSVELSLNNIDILTLDLDNIAPSLHYFYVLQNSAIRSSVLRLCSLIETISPESITEKYQFDYLIAASICQKPPDTMPKSDEEKIVAFSYVSILLKYRQELPTSILRALVSLYNVPVVSWSGPYKKLIVNILGEASLYCDNISEVPEISQIFVDSLVSTGSQLISSLIAYSIENRLSIIEHNRTLAPLLAPFAQLETSEKLSNARKALSSFLRTWPGILYYGVQSEGISNLIKCLPHQTDAVIAIFRDLLKLDGSIEAVTDGYSGLFLSILLKLDLIEKLNQLANIKTAAALFLNELLPFTNHQGMKSNDLISNQCSTCSVASVNVPNMLLFDLAQTMTHEKQVTTINNFTLDPDPKTWEWTQILILLTVVLPHNEAEANSTSARNFYKSLFNYYSGSFLSQEHQKDSFNELFSSSNSTTMAEPLFALIHLLMNKSWGSQIIESCTQMKKAMLQVLNTLCENVVIDPSSPQWALFKCVTTLMSEGNGISILSHWGFHDILTTLGCKCTNPVLCENILETMKLYPEADLSIPIFLQFLSSPIAEVHKIAINDLRRKRSTTPNFLLIGLRGLLMPHVKDLCATNSEQKLPIALNLLGEIISTDDQSLLTVATDKQLHEMLSQSCHFIYSLLLSKEEALRYAPSIDDEIEWWMNPDEGGNCLYLNVFDKAVESTFLNNLDVSVTNEPSIFNHNGFAPLPPHLFGQLSRTKVGLEKLTNAVPRLVDQLKSDESTVRQKRAAMFALAHFASVPYTMDTIEKYDIAELMITTAINSSSYVLKGSLITVLSLFAQSKYISSVLQKHNWQLYIFGNHHCVIPCDPIELFNESEIELHEKLDDEDESFLKLNQIHEIENNLKKYHDIISLLKQLANTLLVKNARQKLAEIFHTPKKDVGLALYANKLLSTFSFSPDSRQFIYFLFRTVPLMNETVFDISPKTRDIVHAKLNILEKEKNSVPTPFNEIRVPK